jgi:hypothetical protein
VSRLLRLAGALATLCVSVPALGQACKLGDLPKTVASVGYDMALQLIKAPECLGASGQDADPLVRDFDRTIARSTALDRRYADAIEALANLARYAEDSALASPRSEDWHALARALRRGAQTLAQVPEDLSEGEAQTIAERAIPLSWSRLNLRPQGEVAFDDRAVRLLATGCADTAPSCPLFEDRERMIRVVNLAVRLRGVTQRPGFLLHVADARLQAARWEAYRSKGQHQYFWEVWLNGLFMGKDLCPKDPASGIERGFCATPTSQWIVMHPEAGLRWVRSATRSSELKPAFVIETLGYYRWRWRSGKSAEMTGQLGGSLVAAYSDVDTGRKWSWGPMIHFGNGYNLALTKASGERLSLLISVNLAERYFGRRQAFADYLKQLDKPGLADLLRQ